MGHEFPLLNGFEDSSVCVFFNVKFAIDEDILFNCSAAR